MNKLLSPKLVRRRYGDLILHEHWCPGCGMMHQIAVETPFRNGARWTFDGNAERPTFSPSVHIRGMDRLTQDEMDAMRRGSPHPQRWVTKCHYFIRAGRIEFCGDSTHALAGKTVDLPDIPADELD